MIAQRTIVAPSDEETGTSDKPTTGTDFSRLTSAWVLILASLAAGHRDALAGQRTWKNSSADFNASSSWVETTTPGSNDVAYFNSAPNTQPILTSNLSIAGLYF